MIHEDGKVVSLTHWPPLPPRRYLRYSFLLRARVEPRTNLRPEELSLWKMLITSAGIKPETFRLLAQCVIHESVLPPRPPNSLDIVNIQLNLNIEIHTVVSFFEFSCSWCLSHLIGLHGDAICLLVVASWELEYYLQEFKFLCRWEILIALYCLITLVSNP
jgi:hypothetical protein